MSGFLKTLALGGYDKQEALMLIDAYNQRIFELELAIKERIPIANAFNPPPLPRKVRIGGFDAKDFDVYYSELRVKVVELEKKHRTIMTQ